MTEFFINPYITGLVVNDGVCAEAPVFHRKLPGYAATDTMDAPALATRFGLGGVSLKVETVRFGLPSFKILGASYAMYWTLRHRYGIRDVKWHTIEELGAKARKIGTIMFVAATDGNHGRGVARMARMLEMPARIYVPRGTAQARIDAIASEDAEVRVVEGGYDETVQRAAKDARRGIVLVQDTSWLGYQDIPRQVVRGYSTLFQEIDDTVREGAIPEADVVLVPIGVGSLAEAAVRHHRRAGIERRPVIIGYEPVGMACAMASARAGRRVSVSSTEPTIMAGMNCGTLSMNAWPLIMRGVDAFIAIEDRAAIDGMRLLHSLEIRASETGAACVGALAALASPDFAAERARLGITAASRVLTIVTEGITDAAAYAAHVGADRT